jgi:hypothetical protein
MDRCLRHPVISLTTREIGTRPPYAKQYDGRCLLKVAGLESLYAGGA